MKNFSYQTLIKQARYLESDTQFKIDVSETGLYLKRVKRSELTESFFTNQEYSSFELEDIHVTVLETYEPAHSSSRKGAFRRSSPFHITLRLFEPASGDVIIIHDFYSALDLSRDFHIQYHCKMDANITYLPSKLIDLAKIDILIDKEINLVHSLMIQNDTHENKLTHQVDILTHHLYGLAAFPESSDKKEFLDTLNELIGVVETLIDMGHKNQERRLTNLRAELAHLTQLNAPQAIEAQETSQENAQASEVISAAKKKTAPKHAKKVKKKIDPELDNYLKAFCARAEDFKKIKDLFLKKFDEIINASVNFDPRDLLEHCHSRLDLIDSLSLEEAEKITLGFFANFSIQSNADVQERCRPVADFFAENMPFFPQHMRKLSMTNYELFDFRFSALALAFMNNNGVYWEFMHRYGMSFSDNRHIIYNGMAGNLFQSMIISINAGPKTCIDCLIPFTQRLFHYLEEDGSTLMNMKFFDQVINADKKRISAQSLVKKSGSKPSIKTQNSIQKLKRDMLEEPFGTVVMMDAIQTWLLRSLKQTPSVHEIELMPKLIDMMDLVLPQVKTESMLNAFERFIALENIGPFNDLSYVKMTSTDIETLRHESPIILLSQFSLKYVGKEYYSSINRLMDVFIRALNERCQLLSNVSMSKLMHAYFEKSQGLTSCARTLARRVVDHSMFSDSSEETKQHEQFTCARMAYFLFTIKANRNLFLTKDDYRVMLHFYQSYLNREISRFDKRSPLYEHQRRVCLHIMEKSHALIQRLEMLADEKQALMESKEYQNLQLSYKLLSSEPTQSLQAKI